MCDLITYGDNYDPAVRCEIEGDYDLSKKGTYKLKYHLTDGSNNKKDVNVTVNVIEKPKNNNSGCSSGNTEVKKKLFSDVNNTYKTEDNEIGIDVSKWQGEIDFQKVKNAGASFVMMRIGVQKGVHEDLVVDEYFLQNIKNAKEAGLKVGVYLYSIATNKIEAKEHAEWVIKTLNKEKLDLPVAFDWENWSKWNSYKISFHNINEVADTFMKTIKDNGYDAMLYGSKFYLETIWNNKKYPTWLAHYTDKKSYKEDYLIWQLSNIGKIDGINGDVDIDIMYHK